ncbi:hypothetical protein FBU30_007806 [Linnemannia zychae]|nr:hypothetical protein FBU30_007806 [Linnemannia zychae]
MILDNMPKSGASSRNPFNLPELRQVISLFVAAKDAISCALVCKAWTDDFVHAIWHTVDFGKHPGFINLPQDIISKHGHYIRVINSLAHSEDLSWFDHAAIRGMANAPFTYKGRGAILQQIPMACSRLEKLSFHAHEVDMYDIEGGDWICKDLEILQIRVKGLDTKEKIAKAVELWRFGTRERWRRQVKESKTAEMIEADAKEQEEWKEDERKDEVSKVQGSIDTSIEARVARHLLKFEKLQVVYLGDYDLVSLEEKFSV